MEVSQAPVVYIRFRKKIAIRAGTPIRLGTVAQLISEPDLEMNLKQLLLRLPGKTDGNMILIDMMQVVRRIRESFPGTRIEHFGDPHILVELVDRQRKPNAAIILLVWLLLFVGSGLAIMNFHADVSMLQVHRRIYELVTGHRSDRPYLFQIPYSLGIGVGMVLFFNHLFKKKFNEEPSPLEVEMFLYQENMNHYMIAEEYGRLQGRKDATAHEDGGS